MRNAAASVVGSGDVLAWEFAETASALVACTAAFGLMHAVALRTVVRRRWVGEPHYLAQLVVAVPAASAIGISYSLALASSPPGAAARDFEAGRWHWAGMCANVGVSLYEMCLYARHGKPLPFWFHHVCVCVALTAVLLTGELAHYIAWVGLSELTNIPLSAVLLMQAAGRKASPMYPIAGAALWASFLVARVLSLGAATAFLIWDGVHSLPSTGGKLVRPVVRYGSILGTCFLWGLSIVWFVPITRGLVRAVGRSRPVWGDWRE